MFRHPCRVCFFVFFLLRWSCGLRLCCRWPPLRAVDEKKSVPVRPRFLGDRSLCLSYRPGRTGPLTFFLKKERIFSFVHKSNMLSRFNFVPPLNPSPPADVFGSIPTSPRPTCAQKKSRTVQVRQEGRWGSPAISRLRPWAGACACCSGGRRGSPAGRGWWPARTGSGRSG